MNNIFSKKEKNKCDGVIALAGNPNVGKSSIFNRLTGMKQHTGNWPGKTVELSRGRCNFDGKTYDVVDLPGTYSLFTHSPEEEVARSFLCDEAPDAVIVVCDATCLMRSLSLALQVMEITPRTVICVNLMDEARKNGITIDIDALSKKLGVPVVGTSARRGAGLSKLLEAVDDILAKPQASPFKIKYLQAIEDSLGFIIPKLPENIQNPRAEALRLLQNETSEFSEAYEILESAGIKKERISDVIASCVILNAEDTANGVIEQKKDAQRSLFADRLLTNKLTGIPVMLCLFALIFYLTIAGANLPSAWLGMLFAYIEQNLLGLCLSCGVPEIIYSPLIFGVYHVLTRVIAVMLPPMAIFFPLFTFLEDLGYLPRIAFNLDKYFKKCSACGKQALTMCMGFGCNAVGVTGCRIIDSPRERLIAILTNCFVPCNGKFPSMISVISIFFVFSASGILRTVSGTLILTALIILGILTTLLVSKILSKTVLKGEPSSFTLELPPYRRPDIGSIIVRSLLDRALFVLTRAVSVAAPAGLVIWIFANVDIGGISLLTHVASFLDPFARAIGLDGSILFSFILGFPANETVMPLIIMNYMSGSTLSEAASLTELRGLLIANGWTWLTAVNMLLFSLMHWPCSTTLLTIKKETGSIKWTILAFILPTVFGVLSCFIFTSIVRICSGF